MALAARPMALWCLLAALLAGATQQVDAQDKSQPPSQDVCTLADSEALRSDSLGLLSLVESVEHADRRLPPESEVLAGLAALQLSRETYDRGSLGRALDHLDKARSGYQEDACFFYYRGVVRRELGTRGFFLAEVWARLRNRDNVELAIQDFQRAAELRPRWLAPISAMAQLSIDALEGKPGRRERWQRWATSALERYTAEGGSEPEADLWRGRLLMESELFVAALLAFHRYGTATDAKLAKLEAARALFALDLVPEAAEVYRTALEGLADSAMVTEIRRDLSHIFDPEEAAEWARLKTGDERADWVGRFWRQRAARDLVSEDERLAEHYARLRYARRHYRLTSESSLHLGTERLGTRSGEVLDDRGLIYVRMGEPEDRVGCFGDEFIYNSWIYRDGDERAALHFSAERGVDDWNLLATIPARCYERLATVEPAYNLLAFRMFTGDALTRLEENTRERNRTERMVQEVLASDRHRERLDGQLEFGYEWLFFRGAEAGTIEATLSYGIPIRHLDCERGESTPTCRVQVRASIFGRDTVLAWLDVTGQLAPRPDAGEWIFGHLQAVAEPGVWSYRVAVIDRSERKSNDRQRGNRAEGAFTLPPLWESFGAPRVSMSSLVLARPAGGHWVRHGQTLALNPLHIYPPDATVDLYYEIYGMPTNGIYTTEFILLKEDKPPTTSLNPPVEWVRDRLEDGRSVLHLSFEESGEPDDQPWLVRRKTLDLTGIRPGKYTFVVAITPADRSTTVYRLTPLRVDRNAR